MIEYDDKNMQQYIKAFKDELGEFFTREDVLALLDRNDFQTVYDIWFTIHEGSTGAPLTAMLILSIPEFITYLKWLPSACFESLPITKITIPSNIKQIYSSCFGYCRLLKEIIILDGCERIDGYAFSFCEELRVLSIPKSINFIGTTIARSSDLLQRIEYRGTRKNWASTKLHWQWDSDSNIHEIRFIDGTIQEI